MLQNILNRLVLNRHHLLASAAILSGGMFTGCEVDVHESPAPNVERDHRGIEIETPRVHVDTDRRPDGDRKVDVKID